MKNFVTGPWYPLLLGTITFICGLVAPYFGFLCAFAALTLAGVATAKNWYNK